MSDQSSPSPKTASVNPPGKCKAFQWWNRRQVDRQHQNAERIRDGLLQDLFAIRRTLEVSQEQHRSIAPSEIVPLMAQLDRLHGDLASVSNDLSRPFAQDNLNLAIQYVLRQWHDQHPKISLTSSLKTPHPIPTSGHSFSLMLLTEWLEIITPMLTEAAQLDVTLDTQGRIALLTLSMGEPNASQRGAIARHQDLAHLCQAFQCLANGEARMVIAPRSERSRPDRSPQDVSSPSTHFSTHPPSHALTHLPSHAVQNLSWIHWQFRWPLDPPLSDNVNGLETSTDGSHTR